jgi:hypothetical protein
MIHRRNLWPHLRALVLVLAIGIISAACVAHSHLIAAGAGAASQPAEPPNKQPPGEDQAPLVMDGPVSFDLDTLIDGVALSGQQTRSLEPKFDAMEDAVAQWDQDHTEQLDAFEAIAGQLVQSKNVRELQYVFDKYRALLGERTKLIDHHKDAILATLNPTQRAAWEATKLRSDVESRLGEVQLTDEQWEKVKALCAATGKTVMTLDPSDPKIFISQGDRVWKLVREKVLTDDQRKTLDNPEAAM